MKIYLILLLALLASCNFRTPQPNGFDLQTWRSDRGGCQGKRGKLHTDFEKAIKPQLKGLSENQVIDFLGRADLQELSKRNQKFARYYITPGKQCKDSGLTREGSYLQLRFDALNNVNEIVTLAD